METYAMMFGIDKRSTYRTPSVIAMNVYFLASRYPKIVQLSVNEDGMLTLKYAKSEIKKILSVKLATFETAINRMKPYRAVCKNPKDELKVWLFTQEPNKTYKPYKEVKLELLYDEEVINRIISDFL